MRFIHIFLLGLAVLAAGGQAEAVRRPTQLIYQETVYEMASTPHEALETFEQDRETLEKICRRYGGTLFETVHRYPIPEPTPDGLWLVAINECRSDLTLAQGPSTQSFCGTIPAPEGLLFERRGPCSQDQI